MFANLFPGPALRLEPAPLGLDIAPHPAPPEGPPTATPAPEHPP